MGAISCVKVGAAKASASLKWIAAESAIDHPPNSERIGILQLGGQRGFGNVLITNGPRETIDRRRAHRSEPLVGSSRIRAAVVHRVTHFDSRREPVAQQPSRFLRQNLEQCLILYDLFRCP